MAYLSFLRAHPRFLAFGFGLTMFSSFGQTYFLSMFGGAWRRDFGLSHGDFGLVYSVVTAASGLVLGRVGRAIDDIDLRRFTFGVCAGLGVACLLLSSATSLFVLAVGIYGVRFCGQGLLGHTAMTTMARYFERERGRALSIAALGFTLGSALFPGLAVALLEWSSWSGAWRLSGIVVLVVLLPGAQWLLRGHAARHAAFRTRAGASTIEADRGVALRDRRFYLVLPAFLATPCILTGLIFHQIHLAHSKGWSVEWLAACMFGFAMAQWIASLTMGVLVDRFGPRRLLPLFTIPLVAGLSVLATSSHPGAAVAYLTLAGATTGAVPALSGATWTELYGVVYHGAIRALTSSCMVISTALMPYGMGALLDAGVSLETIAGSSAILTAALALLTIPVAQETRRSTPGTRQDA